MSTETVGRKPGTARHEADDSGVGALGWLTALRTRFGLQGGQTLRATLENALKGSNTADASAFSAGEREMLLRILRFGTLRVDDVMVPRADIIAVDESEALST